MDQANVGIALGLTLAAGLATGLGSAIAFFARRTNHRLLSIGLSFSAGVMLYVSFVEILGKATDKLALSVGDKAAGWITLAGFFGGMAVIALIDRLIPSPENPHEPVSAEAEAAMRGGTGVVITPEMAAKLRRTGLITALAIAIHNFPEGLATFFAALDDPKVGIALAVAIALHNIPEGISVSVPLYYATGDRKKAFLGSFASGLAEPVGALLGFFLLAPFFTPTLMGILFAAVAGIMVFISLDELLPTARLYAQGHDTVYGIVGGLAVMAVSLQLMK